VFDYCCANVCAVYIETMKSLGYPRPISLDNFRTPNFELVADCLQWLIHRQER
jgi:clusterin-associated protein 1